MATITTEETGTGSSFEGVLSEQQLQQQICQSGEALAEWRSSEQLENGIPSTSPPYWDSDDDDDGGPRPSELYGKYTWKIDKFSQINKRELRSNAFEVGGYKWYILIYPQGCDVCNHLSLFLCVANHDKLLPGWSHFAQFTIAVVNKDPKKSKYSDTLHRFWKKEHDWGWKKFMELSKVFDGFIDADTLVIKAQVQVIREKADRPFRCLDCQYRRELIRVYLTNVEQICRRFVEERRSKLGKLIEDKARWSSFCAFWLSMDKSSRRRMSREKTDSILKIVVKHFFIEKEVTSTLVMDSLYSGLKALEGPYKDKKTKGKYLEAEEFSGPVVRMEEDMFVLIDDVLLLLERAAMEPLPPKDDKGPQNRMKDGSDGEEFNKDSIERDERRLTQLGRRTVEIFILAHIFSKIEVAYQEAVALKKQEELIREEEAAWLAEIEHKARRDLVEKEKKSKKKQGKQKRNNRKGKDKGRYDKSSCLVQVEMEQNNCTVEIKDFIVANEEMTLEKSDAAEDVSDVSDSVDCVPETLPPDSEYRDVSPVNWDTDTSEVHPPTEASSSGISGLSSVQNGNEGRSSSVVDDSSSTSSSDSVPSVALSVPHKTNSRQQKNRKSSSRGRNHQLKLDSDSVTWVNEANSHPSEVVPGGGYPKTRRTSKAGDVIPRAADRPFQNMAVNGVEHCVAKDEEIGRVQRNLSAKYEVVETSWDAAAGAISPSSSLTDKNAPIATQKFVLKAKSNPLVGKKPSTGSPKQADISVSLANSARIIDTQKTNALSSATPKPLEKTSHIRAENCQVERVTIATDKLVLPQMPVISRPLSAPIIPVSRVAVSVVPTVPASPVLARSASVADRLGLESSATVTQSYVPQSYRNAMMGALVNGSSLSCSQNHTASSVVNASFSYSQVPALASTPLFSHHSSDRMNPNQMKPTFSFGMMNHHDILQNGRPVWIESCQRVGSRNLPSDNAALGCDTRNFDLYSSLHNRSQDHHPSALHSLGRQTHVVPDEFPYLDIINDLLDDENGIGSSSMSESNYPSFLNGHSQTHHLSHQFNFGDTDMLNGSNPQVSFERTRSFNADRFQHRYARGTSSETLRDMIPHTGPGSYANEQVAGLIPSQWQIPGSERPPFLNLRSSDSETYPYRLQEFQNLSLGINGYPVFRP